MNTPKSLLAVAVATVLAGCASRHIAYHSSDPELTKRPEILRQSIPLFLPRTVLEYRATGEMEIVSSSPLYRESKKGEAERRFDPEQLAAAAKLIDVEVGTEASKTIKLKDSTLAVRGERDSGQLFFVHLDNGWLTAVDFDAEYASDGVVGSVSSSRQNQTAEFTLKTLESAAAIAATIMKSFVFTEQKPTRVIKDDVPGRLAKRVLEIRKHRDELRFKATERAGLDGAGLSRLLDELDKEEEPLLAAFTGKTKKSTTPIQIIVRPARDQQQASIVLTDFDTDGGFARSEPVSGLVTRAPFPAEFLGKDGKSGASLQLKLTGLQSGERTALDKLGSVVRSDGANGLPYQVPAQLEASVVFVDDEKKETPLLTTDVLIGQWGVVSRLPVSMGTPGSTLKPVYYTETGGLKKLTIASKPHTTDPAKSLNTAAGTIAEAKKAKDEASSEIADLKKQKEKLELDVAIKKAKAELGVTGSP